MKKTNEQLLWEFSRDGHQPGIVSPVHGVDLSEVTPQRAPCPHLYSDHGVHIRRDLWKVTMTLFFGLDKFIDKKQKQSPSTRR